MRRPNPSKTLALYKPFTYLLTCVLFWNVKWLFARFTFCHSTLVMFDTEWQNTCMLLERIHYTNFTINISDYIRQILLIDLRHLNLCLRHILGYVWRRYLWIWAQITSCQDCPVDCISAQKHARYFVAFAQAVHMRPLLAFRSTEPVLLIFHKISFTKLNSRGSQVENHCNR